MMDCDVVGELVMKLQDPPRTLVPIGQGLLLSQEQPPPPYGPWHGHGPEPEHRTAALERWHSGRAFAWASWPGYLQVVRELRGWCELPLWGFRLFDCRTYKLGVL